MHLICRQCENWTDDPWAICADCRAKGYVNAREPKICRGCGTPYIGPAGACSSACLRDIADRELFAERDALRVEVERLNLIYRNTQGNFAVVADASQRKSAELASLRARVEELRLNTQHDEQETADLLEQRDALADALEKLVRRYMKNRGSKGEFIACITPPHRGAAKPDDPFWAEWDTAIVALRKAGRL